MRNYEKKNQFLAGIIGNLLDRYDMALYGLMASFIATNFFPSDVYAISLIKTYGVMALGIFTRPLGAFVAGRAAMALGAKKVMIICLCGVAISTGFLGLIPSYQSIGTTGTVIFVLVRIVQGTFASGENTVASFFLIESSESANITRTSGLFNCSTMLGVVIASAAATLVSYSSDPTFYWRYAFIFGFFTAIIGIILRLQILVDYDVVTPNLTLNESIKIIRSHKLRIMRIIFVGSFSYITYTIPFVFMNSFIPQITSINIGEMLQLNSILLVFDTALIPIFTIIAENFDRRKFMALMSASVAVFAIPLFYNLQNSSYGYVIFVRLFIILAGLAYLAPLQAWYYKLFNKNERYLVVGFASSLGEEIIGRNSIALCLSLWYYFESAAAPAFFITFVGVCATVSLLVEEKDKS